MKRYLKIFLITLIILSISTVIYAVTLTKDNLKESINGYITGQKTAHTTLEDDTEVTIENLNEYNFVLEMSDDNIKISNDEETINISYNIGSGTCTFKEKITVNNNMTEDEFMEKVQDSLFMPLCYVSVCDVYGKDSNESLNRISQKIQTAADADNIDNEEIIGYSKEYVSRIEEIEDDTFNIQSEVINETSEELTENLILNVDLNAIAGTSSTQLSSQLDTTTASGGDTSTTTTSSSNKTTSSTSNKSNVNSTNTNMPYTGENDVVFILTILSTVIVSIICFIKYNQYKKIIQ